ncbi:hypothetical protein [Microseira wollei]|uniref:hypothetical protein n=1 Tax=Microseira wollei TaxID=467598 RepID=UPI001CFDE610|nr:hypothetical protein [Microseira wollei]
MRRLGSKRAIDFSSGNGVPTQSMGTRVMAFPPRAWERGSWGRLGTRGEYITFSSPCLPHLSDAD